MLENDTETNVSSAREAMTAFSTALPEDLVSASANGGGKGAGGASGSPEKAFALKNERATTYALRLDVDLEAILARVTPAARVHGALPRGHRARVQAAAGYGVGHGPRGARHAAEARAEP